MPQYDPEYGPKIDIVKVPGMSVATSQVYRGTRKHPQLWSGMVTLFWMHEPMFDIEVNLMQGADSRFLGLPQRPYEKDGETKYKKLVYINAGWMAAAMKEAIEVTMDPRSTTDDDPLEAALG